jgi:hypothetical protein
MAELRKLRRASVEAFPSFVSPDDWFFARAFEPHDAASLRASASGNSIHATCVELNALVAPFSLATTINLYFLRTCEGTEEEAERVLDAARARGAALP